jgi:hypothetical protein
MSRSNWTAILVFGAVVLLVVVAGCGLLWILSGALGGMMGPRITGPGGMTGGWCPWCGGRGVFGGGTLAGLFLLFAVLVVLGLLGMLVVGAVWLARSSGKGENSAGSN